LNEKNAEKINSIFLKIKPVKEAKKQRDEESLSFLCVTSEITRHPNVSFESKRAFTNQF
jgi:hypothetical protein